MKLRKLALLIVVTLCALMLAGCQSGDPKSEPLPTNAPVVEATEAPAAEADATAVPVQTGKVVNVYNWEDYIAFNALAAGFIAFVNFGSSDNFAVAGLQIEFDAGLDLADNKFAHGNYPLINL